MIKKNIFTLTLFLFVFAKIGLSQSPKIKVLEKKVYANNNALKFTDSQKLILAFLKQKDITNQDRYYAYLFLSYTYKRLYDYPSNLRFLDSALFYGSKNKNSLYYINNILAQKAFALFDMHKYNEAKLIMMRLAKSNYYPLDEEPQAKIIMQEAYLLYLNRDFVRAEKRYAVASQKMIHGDSCDLPMIYAKQIELYGAMNQDDLMQRAYKSSIERAKECKILKYEIYTNEEIEKAYLRKKNYEKAYFYERIKDSLNTIYNTENHLANLKMQLEKNEMAAVKHKLALNEAALKNSKLQRIILLFAFIALFMGFGIFSLIRKRKEEKDKLDLQREFTQGLFSKFEIERQRIGMDLHDCINQELLALKTKLNHKQMITEDEIHVIINQIREVSRDLYPAMFDEVGFETSVDALCLRFSEMGLYTIAEIDYKNGLNKLNEIHIYRIIQEALNNVYKHAQAKSAKIVIKQKPKLLILEIRDNGKGFDMNQKLEDKNSFGLKSMLQRTKLLGGEAKIVSLESGTRLLFNFPIS